MKKNQFILFPFVSSLIAMHQTRMITSGVNSSEKTKTRTSVFSTITLTFVVIAVLIGLFFLTKPLVVLLSLLVILTGMYWIGSIRIHKSSLKETNKKQNPSITSKKNGVDTYNKIIAYIIKKKKYRSTTINLNQIASQFNISSGYLSQLINVHAQKSFNDVINELRINDAQQMLLDTRYDHYTIESIGLECGFKSKSNFYTSFKKITGLTPNQYKKLKK